MQAVLQGRGMRGGRLGRARRWVAVFLSNPQCYTQQQHHHGEPPIELHAPPLLHHPPNPIHKTTDDHLELAVTAVLLLNFLFLNLLYFSGRPETKKNEGIGRKEPCKIRNIKLRLNLQFGSQKEED